MKFRSIGPAGINRQKTTERITAPVPLAPFAPSRLRARFPAPACPPPRLTPSRKANRLRQPVSRNNHVHHLNHVQNPSCPLRPPPVPLRLRPFRPRPRPCPSALRTHGRPTTFANPSPKKSCSSCAACPKPVPLAPFAASRLRARFPRSRLPAPRLTQSRKANCLRQPVSPKNHVHHVNHVQNPSAFGSGHLGWGTAGVVSPGLAAHSAGPSIWPPIWLAPAPRPGKLSATKRLASRHWRPFCFLSGLFTTLL